MAANAQPIEAILVDVDGTLIDSYRLYIESYRRALEPYLGYSLEAHEVVSRTPSSERQFIVDWIGERDAAACHEAMKQHYSELHQALAEGMYEGVREMLAGLRSAAIPLGVVTGKGRGAWEVTLQHFDLGSFASVVTDDDVDHPKPHPGGLLHAAAEMKVAPESVVYLGDSVGDMEAGRAAGMKVAAALWPKTEPGEPESFREAIAPFAPDWVFERPADVVRTFAAWC